MAACCSALVTVVSRSRTAASIGVLHLMCLMTWVIVLDLSQIGAEFDNTTLSRRAVPFKLTVAAVLEEPYVMMRPNAVFLTGNDRFEGFVVDILRMVAEGAGFDYEICLSTDGRYGHLGADGQWDGVIGEVTRRERDMAVGPLVVNDLRRQAVDFTEPFLSIRSSAMLLRSSTATTTTTPTAVRRGTSISAAASSELLSAGGTHGTAGNTSPLSAGFHLLLSTDRTFGVVRDGAARRQLETSDEPLLRAAWARLIGFWPSAIVGTVDEGADRVHRSGGRFVLVADSPAVEYAVSRRPCDLVSTDPFLERADYAFAVARDADPSAAGESRTVQLRRDVDRQLVRLRRNSTLQTLYLKWWRSECKATRVTSPPVGGTGSQARDRDRDRPVGMSSGSPKPRSSKQSLETQRQLHGVVVASSSGSVHFRQRVAYCSAVLTLALFRNRSLDWFSFR